MGLEFAEEVAILRMDFGKANAIGDAFLQKMSALLEEVAARKARALVLTGDGRIFCAGLDLPPPPDRGAGRSAPSSTGSRRSCCACSSCPSRWWPRSTDTPSRA